MTQFQAMREDNDNKRLGKIKRKIGMSQDMCSRSLRTLKDYLLSVLRLVVKHFIVWLLYADLQENCLSKSISKCNMMVTQEIVYSTMQ